jgi:3-hydroxyisobutyrate dehydrogenase-like beta-hydroxyacid dehydrogenase
MRRLRWGIIGFGEAGSAFAKHISQRIGQPVFVTDPLLNQNPVPSNLRERLQGSRVEIISSIPRLVEGSDIVISLVTPRAASEVALMAGAVRGRSVYVDFNSISPTEKRDVSRSFHDGAYLDGAVLGSVAVEGALANVAVAGPQAKPVCARLRSVGLRVSVAGAEVGAASALKMCRSIFMKGIECLLVETLLAAKEFKITDSVLKSIEKTLDTYGLYSMVQMLVTTHAVHCCRRADEMRSVTKMLDDMGTRGELSKATRAFLEASCRAGLPGHFKGRVPKNPDSVIKYLSEQR